MGALLLAACSSGSSPEPEVASYGDPSQGDPSQLASVAQDFLLVSRNGIDAQTFSTYNETPVDDTLGLWDSSYSSSSVNPNVYRIVVSVGSDGLIDVVRPYGTSGAVTIPSGGSVVTASNSMLPWLNGLAVDDPLNIKMTTACEARPWGAIPMIVFHSITDATAFEAQLQAIDEAGYTTLSIDDVSYYLDGGIDDCFHTMPEKPIVLTFDDGYANQFSVVPSLLNEYDMTGVFFIITSYPGTTSTWATWSAISDAVDAYPENVELACHSNAAHTQIGGVSKYLTMSDTDAIADMETCRDKLHSETGVDTTALAWPFGSHNAALTEDAREAGFETMENTWPGLNVADNDDASANVRRFGSDGTSAWSTIETTLRRWYVCQ